MIRLHPDAPDHRMASNQDLSPRRTRSRRGLSPASRAIWISCCGVATGWLLALTTTSPGRKPSRRIEHPALDVIGLLRGLKAYGETSGSLAGAPQCKQEQEHRERDGAVA